MKLGLLSVSLSLTGFDTVIPSGRAGPAVAGGKTPTFVFPWAGEGDGGGTGGGGVGAGGAAGGTIGGTTGAPTSIVGAA
jgi:hypothetical protein